MKLDTSHEGGTWSNAFVTREGEGGAEENVLICEGGVDLKLQKTSQQN
jgi:hypothetical protein